MSDTATRLRAHILADATIAAIIGTSCHQSHVPQEITLPYVWFGRTGTEDIRTLDASAGLAPFSEAFDVEAISDDLSESQTLALAIKSRLNNYRGTFDDSTVKGIFVEDHNDDYMPRGVMSDEGFAVAAMRCEIIP